MPLREPFPDCPCGSCDPAAGKTCRSRIRYREGDLVAYFRGGLRRVVRDCGATAIVMGEPQDEFVLATFLVHMDKELIQPALHRRMHEAKQQLLADDRVASLALEAEMRITAVIRRLQRNKQARDEAEAIRWGNFLAEFTRNRDIRLLFERSQHA